MTPCWNCNKEVQESDLIVSDLTQNAYCPACGKLISLGYRRQIEAAVDRIHAERLAAKGGCI